MKITKRLWVIMDKNRKVIGKGVPRNRSLEPVDRVDGTTRILTYSSKGRAEAGFRASGFYTFGLEDYFKNEYGCWYDWENRTRHGGKISDYLEAVEVDLTLEEVL